MEGVRLFRDGVDVIDTVGVGTVTNDDLLLDSNVGEAACTGTGSVWFSLVFCFLDLKEKILFKLDQEKDKEDEELCDFVCDIEDSGDTLRFLNEEEVRDSFEVQMMKQPK